MTNTYGLDARYFKEKLSLIIRDIEHYTPMEMDNVLTRLAEVAYRQSIKTIDNRDQGIDQDWMYDNID